MRPTWGDLVRIRNQAPTAMQPGSLGSVCGMREVETATQAADFGCAVGTRLYLVELPDGRAFEIAEALVELVEEG